MLDALGVAQLVLTELAAVDEHLRLDESGAKVAVRVVRADGAVVQELSTARALELLAGEPARTLEQAGVPDVLGGGAGTDGLRLV